METYEKLKESEKGAWVSICAYIMLSLLKTAIGYWTGSEALTADGFNNATDIILSLAVLVGLKISRKPPDQDHAYGHFRAESISSLVASFIMITVSLQVMVQAGRTLIAQTYDTPDIWASWTALGSAAVMYAVYSYNKKLAAKSGSESLMAAAKDNLSDAMVSLGVVVGVIGSHLGLPWLDPVAALVVGVMIAKTAVEIFKSSAYNLTDGFDENDLDAYRRTAAATPGVLEIKDMKARFLGSNVLVDMVVLVNPELSVAESHDISDEIEKRMLEEHGIFNAHVHIEPLLEEEEHCYV
ncbi:cation diffusion facilitator family transporter [Paenibacillus sp. YN15]|uniref:cation diffusion facilitator family transporter n=1 Tax=Paenibacillus sp. YN15 TaxID=1742774 RepID=UPI000DCBD7F4|nr:cation diffusion facilitator family transporter [Paenibacillus sp. YN15]RAU91260.1 transporter [Paenibacillus sp. YN15]